MRNHNVKFIMNPTANMGKAWRLAADLRPVMDEYGGADWAGSVFPTHAVELARQAVHEGYEMIIAGGGDGTVHEIINGLMQFPIEDRPKLGVVPLGSGNDFAHGIGMPEEPWEALRQIFTGTPRKIDLGYVEDDRGRQEFWQNTVGIGFDAIVTIYSHNLPLVRGFLMYLIAVLKTVFLNHQPLNVNVTVDGEHDWEDQLLMLTLCNGPREGGGFKISPDSMMDDGRFEYVAVKSVSRPMMLRLIPEFMRGAHLRFPKISLHPFRQLEIKSDQSMYIHMDGEIFSGFSSDLRYLKVEHYPKAIQIVA